MKAVKGLPLRGLHSHFPDVSPSRRPVSVWGRENCSCIQHSSRAAHTILVLLDNLLESVLDHIPDHAACQPAAAPNAGPLFPMASPSPIHLSLGPGNRNLIE